MGLLKATGCLSWDVGGQQAWAGGTGRLPGKTRAEELSLTWGVAQSGGGGGYLEGRSFPLTRGGLPGGRQEPRWGNTEPCNEQGEAEGPSPHGAEGSGARWLLAGGTASYTHGLEALVWLLGGKLQQLDRGSCVGGHLSVWGRGARSHGHWGKGGFGTGCSRGQSPRGSS